MWCVIRWRRAVDGPSPYLECPVLFVSLARNPPIPLTALFL